MLEMAMNNRLTVQCSAVQCSAAQRSATQRNATQRNATQRNTTQHNTLFLAFLATINTSMRNGLHRECNKLKKAIRFKDNTFCKTIFQKIEKN